MATLYGAFLSGCALAVSKGKIPCDHPAAQGDSRAVDKRNFISGTLQRINIELEVMRQDFNQSKESFLQGHNIQEWIDKHPQ
ncbi:MAG: DUF3150 domain-containing protein [Desulfovibrio sp.]|jgi:hypothetical protein|nr:DUF3150 domain-containing protein [Desulfovibrio sp.]